MLCLDIASSSESTLVNVALIPKGLVLEASTQKVDTGAVAHPNAEGDARRAPTGPSEVNTNAPVILPRTVKQQSRSTRKVVHEHRVLLASARLELDAIAIHD